jgi:hypothetical protein
MASKGADMPPTPPALIPVHLERLAETARDYARGAKATATQRAYAADWRHYEAWCVNRQLIGPPYRPAKGTPYGGESGR